MGKFSPKNNAPQSDIYSILEERSRNQQRRSQAKAGAKPEPARRPAPRQNPQGPTAPVRQPVQRPQVQENGKKSGVSGLAFAVGCMAFVFVFYLATFVGLNFLRNWLVRFESAQPTAKCAQVFQDLFADPDWAELYDLAGMENTGAQGKEAF